MSYISDWLHSEQTEEDYRDYCNAAARDNARDRWEREHEYDDYEDTEQIKEEICDHYCKMPEFYLSQYKDPDEAHEVMVNECCAKCPLERLNK